MPNSQDFCTIEEALAELQAGRMIVLVDDEHRENEGDLVIAAEKATPEAINFMMRNGCGIVCLAMSPAICDRLHLEPVHGANVDPQATPFTQSIDARTGITTGTSAFDRARTVEVAIDDSSDARRPDPRQGPRRRPARPRGRRPGPRRPHRGQRRSGPAGRASRKPRSSARSCDPDGNMARLPDLREFCKQHNLKMCTIEDLIKYPPAPRTPDPPRADRQAADRATASST